MMHARPIGAGRREISISPAKISVQSKRLKVSSLTNLFISLSRKTITPIFPVCTSQMPFGDWSLLSIQLPSSKTVAMSDIFCFFHFVFIIIFLLHYAETRQRYLFLSGFSQSRPIYL